jgi:glutathione peroxidase
MTSLYDFTAVDINGEDQSLAAYRGKVVLVVNTASRCGFTPQYAGLQQLYQSLREEGLVVLAFPCNQFGGQEPGTAEQIRQFCLVNYGVSFPVFGKVQVNGPHTDPLWVWLKASKGGLLGEQIKWNFTKFLVGRDGQVISRHAPTTKPEDLEADIRAALDAATG